MATAPASSSSLPTTTAATSSAPPPAPFVPTVSPANLSAACPLLGPAELAKLFDDPDAYASSEQPQTHQDQFTAYNCDYHLADPPNTHLVTLSVGGVPSQLSPQKALQLFSESCADDVQSLYAAAMYCYSTDGGTQIVVAKSSHGETRLATLSLVNPPDGTMRAEYTAMMKTLEGRL
ncbi:hypothetical protein VSH64_18410 [Amycolatopsis rhabdoformis]|uniref:DUF3558 domain-containing protein n=1 Tax=Amycolatopsis rhabdoformis TaxID=1448059 RepID=A0ABZ1IJM2_9PSEU|nr:hypothetical protein [Amycolatopsis rhabdoformis]WSE34046.1 hypothetical protein VSH64_18410 [Amycolatopsis rhabdoformis]